MIVVDASVVIGALTHKGEQGRWAEDLLTSETISSTHLMPAEVTAALRRLVRTGAIANTEAQLGVRDVSRMPIELVPWRPFWERAWELRHTVTPYDAWYVALAEALDAPLATLDVRLADAPGPTCRFVTP